MILPTYPQFVNVEAQQVADAYHEGHGVDPAPSDLYHCAWRRLVEGWTHEAILRDLRGALPPPAPGPIPSRDELRRWRGDFNGIHIPELRAIALPANPVKDLFFSPALVTYPAEIREVCYAAYRARNYRHLPINVSDNSIYRNYYPPFAGFLNDPDGCNRLLAEIWAAGLYPVCFLLADADDKPDRYLRLLDATRDLLKIAVVGWERWDIPLETYRTIKRHLAPDALFYHHTAPGASAGACLGPDHDQPGLWWREMIGVLDGGLFQTENDATPATALARFQEIRVRLAGQHWGPAVAAAKFDFVAFEYSAYRAHHSGWTEAQGVAFGDAIMGDAAPRLVHTDDDGDFTLPPIRGFGNGGTVTG